MNPSVPDDLISAYFDGEVTPDERQAVERVLESSSELRQLLDDTSKLSALLHSFPRESVPVALAANVAAQINAQPVSPAVPVKRSLRREWTTFSAAIATTVAVLAVYVAVNSSGNLQHEGVATVTSKNLPSDAMSVASAPLNSVAADSALPQVTNGSVAAEGQRPEANGDLASTNVAFELPSAAPPGHAVAAMEGAATGGRSQRLAAPSSNFSTELSSAVQNQPSVEDQFLPPLKDEFLNALETGQVIVRRMVNPDQTVMVVELTVIDIEKGSEWMQWMFHKRVIGEIDDRESLVTADRANGTLAAANPVKDQMSATKSSKTQSSADDFVVVYAQGPGKELAETISDSIELHPEIFRDWAPKPPIEISPEIIANLEDDSLRRSQRGGAPTESQPGSDDANAELEAVSAVGNLVVDSYVNSQARPQEVTAVIAQDSNQERDQKSDGARMVTSGSNARQKNANLNNARMPDQRAEKTSVASAKADIDARPLNVKKARQENGDPAWAYAAFRVATDQQKLDTKQSVPLIQNSSGNGLLLLGNGSGGYTVAQSRQSQATNQARSNFDQRDPRRMRMLFVLKQAPSAPQP